MRLISLFLALLLTCAVANEEVEINFSDLAIEDFLKMTSKIMGKNLLLTQRVTGNVDFISTKPVKKDEILQIAISVLASRGMTLVEEGGYYKVVRLAEAAAENVPIVKGKATGALLVTQTIRVEEESIDIVVQKIRHLLSPAAKLVTIKESNTMVVSDYPANIETIKQVVDQIVDKRALKAEFIPLKHIKASTILVSVQQIIKGVINTRVVDNEVQILKDDASNAIVVTGRPKHVEFIRNVVRRLDVEDNQANQVAEVIYLQNSEASALVKILSSIVEKTATSVDGKTKPSLSADEEMNVLIALGLPEELSAIRTLVQSLDVPRQQVYVQATIVEVTNDLAENIGVTYGVEGASISGNGIYTLGTNLTGTVPSVASATMLEKLTEKDSSGNYKTNASALAVGVGLNLLISKSAAEILSEPSILCINNKESVIYVGETRSILTSETTTTAGIPTKNFTRQDIGLTLKVKPRLSTNNKVALTIEAQMEGIIGSDSSMQPTTTKRRVATNAIVNDGEPVILGGLVKNEEIKTVSRVPYLSAIPFVGRLFRNSYDDEVKTSLVVIVTPYIVEKSEDLSTLRDRLSTLESLRQRYAKEVIKAVESKKK